MALARALQQSVPCACFGRLGRTAVGGREIGRAIVLSLGAGFVVVHRAVALHSGYGAGPVAVLSLLAMVLAIVLGQRVGMAVRPGLQIGPASGDDPRSFANTVRSVAGLDNDLYWYGG